MGKTTKMFESDSQPIPENSGWSALTTITTFDRGKSSSQKWRRESAVVPKRVAGFTPTSLFVESLVEQFCKIFEKDPLLQKKLYDLICQKLHQMKLVDKTYKVEEFQFMRSHYQRALFHILTLSNPPPIDCNLDSIFNQLPRNLPLPSSTNAGNFLWSRYQNDFEEIEFIARGGFGSVFRVRNKVDGCEYAIKKILFRFYGDDQFFQSLREVRTLAKLDHGNIVAYKAAWFEPFNGQLASEESSSSSGSKVSPDIEPSDGVPESSVSERDIPEEADDDSGEVIFANGNEDASKGVFGANFSSNMLEAVNQLLLESDCDHFNGPSHTAGQVKMLNPPESYGSLCDHSSGSSNKGCRGKKVPGMKQGIECAVLYIQMQLCKESLRKWLDQRNEALQVGGHSEEGARRLDPTSVLTALHIFQGILNGVEYMHKMNVVHHDLKPSNIFVEGFDYVPQHGPERAEASGGHPPANTVWGLPGKGYGRSQVRVGDFGLACRLGQPPATGLDDLGGSGDAGATSMAVVPTDSFQGHGGCLVEMGIAVRDGDKEAREVIGTRLYAAPEQLEGRCCVMSDTYSLAIILFELLNPFFTAMERGKTTSALRSTGNVPDEFQLIHPILAVLIKDMLSQNPSKRPQIGEIVEVLNSILPKYESAIVKDRSARICSDDEGSVKDYVVRHRSRASSFTQTVEHHQESYATSTHHWEDVLYKETREESSYCGNFTCHAKREQQDETISKLLMENLKKDEIIEELKGRLMQLENNSHSIVGDIVEKSMNRCD
ncbi:eukaryotic translation initiation factor 2-alpha kinase 1-like [Hetaerina americana]|uniref:eukaryotic translation initiation factor 2-alpha kinase 1-like n=1 Tax=Hetaerina americana TaxID=62018 RepID=UPI003A7F3E4E